MKKLLLVAASLFAVSAANAQAAFNIGYENVKQDYTASALIFGGTSSETFNGFNFSYTDNINLVSDLNVNVGAGLNFDFKSEDNTKNKYFGVFVPVDFNYGFGLGSDLKLSVFAGPTFKFGIVDKSKTTISGNTTEYNYYDNDVCDMKRFDVLLGGGIMLDFQDMLRFSVGYKVGMIDGVKEVKVPLSSAEMKTNVLTVSIGYLF